MSATEVLPIKPGELDDAFEVIRGVAVEELGMPDTALAGYRDLMERAAADSSRSSLFLGARTGGTITGVVLCNRPEGGVATIIWLITGKGQQGNGQGALLLQRACKWAKEQGCHKIKLTASSQRAIPFYERNGMEVEGYHPSHWWGIDFWSLGMRL